MGFAVGNERLIRALTRVKSYLDYGAFTPMQVAATAALNGPYDAIAEMRETYRKRRDVLVESFKKSGWPVPSPSASMFIWAPVPHPFDKMGSVEFATKLVTETGVAVSPGAGFGEEEKALYGSLSWKTNSEFAKLLAPFVHSSRILTINTKRT